MTVHEYLRQLLEEGKSEREIRAAIEPRLPAGCKLKTYSDGSPTRLCAEIFGCPDPAHDGLEGTDCS